MPSPAPTEKPATKEIVLSVTINETPEVVFKAWTEPKLLSKWWGPKGYSAPQIHIDPKPGGKIDIIMRSPEGLDYPMIGMFKTVDAPRLLTFSSIGEDEKNVPHLEAFTTVTFIEENGKTKIALEDSALALTPHGEKMIAGMMEGWSQSFDRLTALFNH
ncbi:MAG: SRPBCC domain-containing protein [Pseudomonadota bacterium]